VAAAGAKKTAARSGHTRICGGVETIPVLPKGSEIRPTKSKSKATPLPLQTAGTPILKQGVFYKCER
jgi:hypothetical protein